MEIHETVGKETQILLFLETIHTTIEQFSMRFVQFRKFLIQKSIKYPDTVNLEIFWATVQLKSLLIYWYDWI